MAIAFPLSYWAVIALSAGSAYAGPNPPKSVVGIHQDVWRTEDGLPQNTVPAIVQSRDGYLWAGTELGLVRFDGSRFTVFDKGNTPELKSNVVDALLEDRAGDLWIGTLGGLSKFKDEKFTTYTTRDGLSSNLVISLHEDAEKSLWIGTSGGGLNRLKQGKFVSYTTRNGLPDDVVYSILEDRQNALWLSSNKGIFRLSKNDLDDFANGKVNSISPVLYGTADGMITRECSGGGHPAGWRGADACACRFTAGVEKGKHGGHAFVCGSGKTKIIMDSKRLLSCPQQRIMVVRRRVLNVPGAMVGHDDR